MPVIANDPEALHIAAEVAWQIVPDLAQRDHENRFAVCELDICSNSGLWSMTVPCAYGDTVTLEGVNHYCTAALLTHLVQIVALDKDGYSRLAIADRNTPGLSIINDGSERIGKRHRATDGRAGTVLSYRPGLESLQARRALC